MNPMAFLTPNAWEPLVIALLGGGGLGAIITALVNSRKVKAEAMVLRTQGDMTLAEAWQGYAQEQAERANRFEREVQAVRNELTAMKAEMEALKIAFTDLQSRYEKLKTEHDELKREYDELVKGDDDR